MRVIIRIVLIVLIVFGINHWKEQKELEEMTDMIKTFQFALPEELDQLIIKKYPEELNYSSFKDDELEQVIDTFENLDMNEVKQVKLSDNYTKLLLKEDAGINQYMEFNVYDNGFIEYKEGSC